jgi:probable addiction module antidote protein
MAKKKMTLRRFDAVNYLNDADSIAGFLTASIEEANGDPGLILHAFNTVLRAQNRNMSQLAEETDITRSGLYEILSGNRNPSFATVLKLLDAMGMSLAITPAK